MPYFCYSLCKFVAGKINFDHVVSSIHFLSYLMLPQTLDCLPHLLQLFPGKGINHLTPFPFKNPSLISSFEFIHGWLTVVCSCANIVI